MDVNLGNIVHTLAASAKPSANITGWPSLHPIMRVTQWLDRRMAKRTFQNVPVTLSANGTEKAATLRDISSTGLGLSDVEELSPGDSVVIGIGGALNIRGTVVWSENGRAGVRVVIFN